MKGKIINDPVYGFLRFNEPELLQIIGHPWFQRLRRIKQMGMAHLVYPGAVHTRFHHSLGACHLMDQALDTLRQKEISFTQEDRLGARMAILLHDVGHGPFSHALENVLVAGVSHEMISSLIMQRFNEEMNGRLSKAFEIFSHSYPKRFLHQLVSSQLDMDRMDYLNRDSFYSGVSEGVISYDRILQMLSVVDNELVVEEKAVHSVEKFIIARRLMYWQVYLHKTVLAAEELILKILQRARELALLGSDLFATPSLKHFLYNKVSVKDFQEAPVHLEHFCRLDDSDITASVKVWLDHPDVVLSSLCRMMLYRQLYKSVFIKDDAAALLAEKQRITREKLRDIPDEFLHYFVFAGHTSNNTYSVTDEQICILKKDSSVIDISEVDDPLVTQTLAKPVVKNYICYMPQVIGANL